MRNLLNNLKMNQAEEGQAGGAPAGEPKPAEQPPAAPAAASGAQPQPEGDQFDNFGYKIEPKPQGDQKPQGEGDKKPEPAAASAKPEKVENPATGYGDTPPAQAAAKPEEKPAPAADPKDELGYELTIDKDLPQAVVDDVKAYAKEFKLSKEAAQKLIDKQVQGVAKFREMEKQQALAVEAEKTRTRAAWDKELREDPVFGGEKFGHNVLLAEKLLQEFMPDTKKALTERKSMLPPYVMRDLVRMADKLYSTEKLQQGEPMKPPEPPAKEGNDPLAYYQ